MPGDVGAGADAAGAAGAGADAAGAAGAGCCGAAGAGAAELHARAPTATIDTSPPIINFLSNHLRHMRSSSFLTWEIPKYPACEKSYRFYHTRLREVKPLPPYAAHYGAHEVLFPVFIRCEETWPLPTHTTDAYVHRLVFPELWCLIGAYAP